MGIHLNDHIDWWFLLPVDCYRQRCMRHVEHTPLKGMLRNMEPSGSVWGLILKVLDTMGLKAQGLQTVNLVFSYEACPKMSDQLRIQNQNLRKRLVLKLHECNCLDVRFWRHDLLWWDFCTYLEDQNYWTTTLRQWGVLWSFEVMFGGCMLFWPRTNVESKQTKTPESKTASHQAEPSVKWY